MLRLALLLALVAGPALAQPAALASETLRRLPAEEARQGVAVDARHLYAVTNSKIGKYDKATGAKLAEWTGDPARFPHINSCAVIGRELVCAASNFPQTPMSSSVEVFDPEGLVHRRTVSLGQQIGSLTWVDRRDGFWWACFANYEGRGGEPGRGSAHTLLVKFDDQWRRLESWSFPAAVVERFKPMSSSGGAWGPDGRLYVTGHDHAELYVLALPAAGATLEHVATIAADIEGQAIAFDRTRPGVVFGISRQNRQMVEIRLPAVEGK